MTHFGNYTEREVFQAINLLKDENLVWSQDMEAIRRNLADMLERIMQVEWHYLEPELGDLALNLIRENERGNHVRGTDTEGTQTKLQD
jgi:regulator of replication initiation timing